MAAGSFAEALSRTAWLTSLALPVNGGGKDSFDGKLAARLLELRKHRTGANGVPEARLSGASLHCTR
jgi:hypothetical protein